jgi:quercetin dioxygenase-like cupin family protein
MYRVRQQDLPFQGSSHQFVGAENGDVNISVFLLSALPGRGPGPHRHPYDEVQFVREGRGLWTVNGEEFEAGAGDILVVKAGEIHSFSADRRAPQHNLTSGSDFMKAYVMTTGVLFALITLAHVWRVFEEGSGLATDPWYVLITAATAALGLWAWRLLRRSTRG